MTRKQIFNFNSSAMFLVATCVWLLSAFAGCGSDSTSGNWPISALQAKDSGPPPGATCTISLYNIPGGDQASLTQAQEILNQIEKQTSWSDLHIVRGEMVTKVCRGYFESYSSDEAQRTLRQVRSYVDRSGQQPFQQAMFSDLPGRQEQQIVSGPAQWDVRRAPGNASLCIDVFTDPKKRASQAVAQVKKLRGKGIEAWYYHGQYRSGVYVGHFDAANEFVTTGRTSGGQPVVRKKFITHDPQFMVLRKKFPAYRLDGKTIGLGNTKLYEASRLVPIPRFDQDVFDSEIGL